jgi:uncharacterized protein
LFTPPPIAHSIENGAAMLAAGLSSKRNAPTAFLGGAVIGALGGLIGLGGAEFRLPLLIGAFGFPALQAVILNKAMSLIVVGSALQERRCKARSKWLPASWRASSLALLLRCSAWRAASC